MAHPGLFPGDLPPSMALFVFVFLDLSTYPSTIPLNTLTLPSTRGRTALSDPLFSYLTHS